MRHLVYALLASALAAPAAFADVVDFEGFEHGRIIRDQIPGISVRAKNKGGGPDLAIIFDTTATGTSDPDLEDPWSGGNLPVNTHLGNILIIAENGIGGADGIVDDPDDEGSRPAGRITFRFDDPVDAVGVDLVDIEDKVLEGGKFVFKAVDGSVVVRHFDTLEARQPSIVWGDNSINRIRPFTAKELGVDAIQRFSLHFGGSGGIDNLYFYTDVPEPSAFALGALALAGWFVIRRRRRAYP